MPGNEVGDRVHNFFGQEILSQGQHHPQVVDGNWPGLSNTLRPGSQIQLNASASFNPNLKNYNLLQSDSERAHGGQTLSSPHGLNLVQSAFQSELGRRHSQSQQQVSGGHMYGHQVFQPRQSEMNHLGADSESNKHNLMSRGFSMLEAQVGTHSNTYNKNLMRFDTSESPAKCNFFGGQQQLSGQPSSTLQSLSRPLSGASDMQLLQQQAMLKQMQELQRQQFQRQQQENVNQFTAVSSQAMGNRSTLINGIPVHNASNFSLPSEMVTSNNWLQRGASSVMQGPSTGHMISHQHNQALQLMGVVPQQVDNSFYGVPVSSTGHSQYSHLQMACNNSFDSNQYTAPEQVSKQDTTLVFRQELQGKSLLGHAAGLIRNNSENELEHSQQQENSNMPESRERNDFARLSETSQEKPVMPAVTSQNVATLDPTEEKILFGSDDSVWDVFGRSAGNVMGATNVSDGTDFAFPSMSSGTWSALMQSAVAETSSGDGVLPEQWSGLNFHNTEQPTGILPTAADKTNGRPHSVWPDASSLNPSPSPFSRDASTDTSYGSISGNLKSGLEIRHSKSKNLQADSSQRSMQQHSADENKWLDQNSIQEGPTMQVNNAYMNISNSSGTETNVKCTLGSWTYQSNVPSCNNNDQQSNGQNGWNFMYSLSPAGGANSRGHRNETDGDLSKRIGDGANYSQMGYPHIERQHAGFTVPSLKSNNEDVKVDSPSATENPSMKANPVDCQQLLRSNNLDFWKHVNPSVTSRGSTIPKNIQPNSDFRSDSARVGHNGLDKGATERHVVDDSNKRENSSDSFCSNASQHTSGATVRRENVWLIAGDSRFLPGCREMSSNQVGLRTPGLRKFHHHPMGDLEVDTEASHGSKQNTSTQTVHQHTGFRGPEIGHLEQSTFSSQVANNSVEADKGRGQPKGLHEDPPRNMVSAYGRDTSVNFDGSAANFSNRTAPPSKNMFELFHEADKQSDHDASRNLSSSNSYASSEMHGAENLDGVGHKQQMRSSVSQHSGLQLGPPSQRPLTKEQILLSQSAAQQVNPFDSNHVSSGTHLQAANRAVPGNIQENSPTALSSGFPYPLNYLQHRAFTNSGGQLATHQSSNLSFNGSSKQLRHASCERNQNIDLGSVANVPQSAQNNDLFPSAETCPTNNSFKSHTKDSSPEFPLLEAMFQKGPSVDSSPKIQNKSPSQEHSWGGQATEISTSHTQQRNDLERTSSGKQKADGQLTQGNPSFDTFASRPEGLGETQSMTPSLQQQLSVEASSSQNPPSVSQGSTSIFNHFPDASPSSIATSQRDIEAFGRSLRPNDILHNFTSVHQMQSTRESEADPSTMSVKRLRGPDSEPVGSRCGQQIFNYTTTAKDTSINHPSAFTKGDHPQVSPQMAPSWFDQYGTLRNGQIFPVHSTKTSMAVDRPIIAGGFSENSLASSSLGKINSAVDSSQPDTIRECVNSELAHGKLSSPLALPSQADDVSLAVRTKKRKSGTLEMIPWSKEIMQCSFGLQNSSISEVEWARATSRLIEKVEDEIDMTEEVTPIRRSKRRLVVTTQLLQQLLCPPPASVMSADVSAFYENQVYCFSRLALGDACSSISSRKDTLLSHHNRAMPSEKGKESERLGEHFSKVAGSFISRAKKLEEDLSKLEKGVTVLDLRLECQDLEKFSVINRFAKFHSRSQADGAETSSSSDANTNSQKHCPQRYVTAVPLPRNIPDRVPCLSL